VPRLVNLGHSVTCGGTLVQIPDEVVEEAVDEFERSLRHVVRVDAFLSPLHPWSEPRGP